MKNFVYLLGAQHQRETVVVDPAWDVEAIVQTLADDNRTLSGVLLTHHHADHLNALEALLNRVDVPVYVQQLELGCSEVLTPFVSAVRPSKAGDTVMAGSLAVTCILTPGHTTGSQCFLAQNNLLTGDTLFVNACGRCDFEHSDAALMYSSLYNVLGVLPADVKVWPGHHYGDVTVSTLAREKEQNPYFQFSSAADFVAFRMRKR